jgi:argininosuccinate synthase
MEKVEDAPFSPLDRIGQLTMRNLDITTRATSWAIYKRLSRRSISSSVIGTWLTCGM